MNSLELELKIEGLRKEVEPILKRIRELTQEKQTIASKEFICINKLTKRNVEMSSGDDKPYFGLIRDFIGWMRDNNCTKLCAEWNGTIYFTSDLLAGRMPHDMPGRIEHLQQ